MPAMILHEHLMYLHYVMQAFMNLLMILIVIIKVLLINLTLQPVDLFHLNLFLLNAQFGHFEKLIEEPLDVII